MEKRNIYKTDDVLIIGSFLMLIPAVFFSWPWLSGLPSAQDPAAHLRAAPELLGGNLILSAAYLAGAVFSQILGRILRSREKETLDILDTVMYMGQASIAQLASNLSMSEGKVRRLTVRLCRVRGLGISLEGDRVSRKSIAPEPAFSAPDPAPASEPDHAPDGLSGFPDGGTVRTGKAESPVRISPELREYLKNDRSDIFGKIEKISRIAEAGGEISPGELDRTAGEDGGENKISRGKIFLIFFFFLTPLWPVALIIVIFQVARKYKMLKDKGMVDLQFGPGE